MVGNYIKYKPNNIKCLVNSRNEKCGQVNKTYDVNDHFEHNEISYEEPQDRSLNQINCMNNLKAEIRKYGYKNR